jgi:hypothetical protein
MDIQGNQSLAKQHKMLKKIRELIYKDHRQTIHEHRDTAGIIYGACQEILT